MRLYTPFTLETEKESFISAVPTLKSQPWRPMVDEVDGPITKQVLEIYNVCLANAQISWSSHHRLMST